VYDECRDRSVLVPAFDPALMPLKAVGHVVIVRSLYGFGNRSISNPLVALSTLACSGRGL
jgi:hypothetical protein